MEESKQGQQSMAGASCKTEGADKLDPCSPQGVIDDLTAEATDLDNTKTRAENKKRKVDEDKSAIQNDATLLPQWDADYKREVGNKERERSEYDCYVTAQRRVIEPIIAHRRRAIEEKIKARKDELSACQATITDLEGAQRRANEKLEAANNDFNNKNTDYGKAKQELADITSKLNALSGIKQLIVTENTQNHMGAVYFLLGELEDELCELKIPSSTEFHAKLYKTFCEWVDEKRKVREASWEKDKSDAELAFKRTECENKKTNFRNSVTEELNAMEPNPCSDKGTAKSS
jgi:hypothetical protein